jgi:uncharacterized protein (DUF433 family)
MITEAIYQDGALRMKRPLNLADQSVVQVQVTDKSATEHPHVARGDGVHHGRPIIRGTRIPVKTVVRYIHMGMTVPEVLAGFPDLTAAQLYDALSYYYDNQAEIEADMSGDELPAVLERFDLVLGEDGRLTPQ